MICPARRLIGAQRARISDAECEDVLVAFREAVAQFERMWDQMSPERQRAMYSDGQGLQQTDGKDKSP